MATSQNDHSATASTSSALHPSMQQRNVSTRGKKNSSTWYGSATTQLVAGSWDDELRYKVASRLLLTIVVFGFLGSFLPVFAARTALGGDAALVGARGGGGGGDGFTTADAAAAFSDDDVGGQRGALLGGDGTKNLVGGELKPCSSPDQATQTGWTRDGSCAWDPSDSGYHEVTDIDIGREKGRESGERPAWPCSAVCAFFFFFLFFPSSRAPLRDPRQKTHTPSPTGQYPEWKDLFYTHSAHHTRSQPTRTD